MRVLVTHSDESKGEYDVKPAAIVAFERKFNVGIGALATERRLEWIYFLAYEAEKKSGAIMPPSFDAWVEKLDDVDLIEDSSPLVLPTPEESPASA